MTTDEQRKAIAAAVGITNIKPCPYRHPKDSPEWVGESSKPFVGWMCCHTKIPRFSGRLPKYTEDLNAMHEAEEAIRGTIAWHSYWQMLTLVCEPSKEYWRATAAQRAEAFLRAIGKWEEAK